MPGVQARWDGRARWLDGSIAAEGGTLQPTSLAAYLDRGCTLPGRHARRLIVTMPVTLPGRSPVMLARNRHVLAWRGMRFSLLKEGDR
jgi:hypothetical protein